MPTVADEEFIELVVRERMQQCYFRWKENSKDRYDETNRIENAFEAAISTLSEKEKMPYSNTLTFYSIILAEKLIFTIVQE